VEFPATSRIEHQRLLETESTMVLEISCKEHTSIPCGALGLCSWWEITGVTSGRRPSRSRSRETAFDGCRVAGRLGVRLAGGSVYALSPAFRVRLQPPARWW